VARDGTIRLCDFGLSRIQEQTAGFAPTTHTYAGTPNFMAPEQFTKVNNMLTFKVDVWAVRVLRRVDNDII
jgi:serine/threonine protein kinase